jgi:hypothetical protein
MVIKYITAKGNNKRITVLLHEEEKAFAVITKTLVDRKTRHIIETKNLFSYETLTIMNDVISMMLQNSEVKNKIFNREKMNMFKAKTNLK